MLLGLAETTEATVTLSLSMGDEEIAREEKDIRLLFNKYYE